MVSSLLNSYFFHYIGFNVPVISSMKDNFYYDWLWTFINFIYYKIKIVMYLYRTEPKYAGSTLSKGSNPTNLAEK